MEELKIMVDLYKFYLGLIVNSGILAGAVISGILGYFVKQRETIVRYKNILGTVGLGFAIIYLACLYPSIQLMNTINELSAEIPLRLTPHAWLLPSAVVIFTLVFMIMSYLFFRLPKKTENKVQ